MGALPLQLEDLISNVKIQMANEFQTTKFQNPVFGHLKFGFHLNFGL
jgi:hypothetical protein